MNERGPQFNQEDYDHEKGDFTDMHDEEFQAKLRSKEGNLTSEKEKIPEKEIERIMGMVQDIDKPGIAYSGVKYKDDRTVEAVLRNGLLDLHDDGQRNPNKQRNLYRASLKDGSPTYKKSYIYFNITGRVTFEKHDPEKLQIEQTMYASWKLKRFVVLFDMQSFKEIPYNVEDKIKNFEFRPQSDKFAQSEVEGFTLEGRVSPKFFTGIIILNYYFDEKEKSAAPIDDELSLPDLIVEMDKAERFLPIYDAQGNLLWPRQMSYEEVKQFVTKRDEDKSGSYPEQSEGSSEA